MSSLQDVDAPLCADPIHYARVLRESFDTACSGRQRQFALWLQDARRCQMRLAYLLEAAGAFVVIAGASAHVTLEVPEAALGASYKATLRVNHGCEGSPTVALRVRMPEGVIAVKPMPKAGWKLDVVTRKYPKPVTM